MKTALHLKCKEDEHNADEMATNCCSFGSRYQYLPLFGADSLLIWHN